MNFSTFAWSVAAVLVVALASLLLLGAVTFLASGRVDEAVLCTLVSGAGFIWAHVIDTAPLVDASKPSTSCEDDDEWF